MTAVTRETVRLSLRELRELPYRALRVLGASHGEAQHIAEAVQVAELNDGSGLQALVASCRSGAWASEGLKVVRSETLGSLVFDVTGTQPIDLLQVGPGLVDLASCVERPCVVRLSASGLDATIDQLLLLAAVRTGLTVFAAQRTDDGVAIRAAAADGALGHGALDASTGADLLPVGPGSADTVIAVTDTAASALLRRGRLRTHAELAERRHEASRCGVHVAADAWAEVLRIASAYKQPDDERDK